MKEFFDCTSGDGYYLQAYHDGESKITISINNENDNLSLVILDKSMVIDFIKKLNEEIKEIK